MVTCYSPVRHSVHTIFLPKDSVGMSSFNLHVLGTPPAFILSQDQTLRSKSALSGVRCEIVPVRLVIYPSSESTPSEEG